MSHFPESHLLDAADTCTLILVYYNFDLCFYHCFFHNLLYLIILFSDMHAVTGIQFNGFESLQLLGMSIHCFSPD